MKGLGATLAVASLPAVAKARDKNRLYLNDNLSLEIVSPRDTGNAKEYEDLLNTGTKLIYVPKSELETNVTQNFKLGEFVLINNPLLIKGSKLPTQTYKGRTFHQFIRLDPRLPLELQKLREAHGSPLRITSPYRSNSYNIAVGGAIKSRHKAGQAADITGRNVPGLYKLADAQFQDGGVGKYSSFVHVDTRGHKSTLDN